MNLIKFTKVLYTDKLEQKADKQILKYECSTKWFCPVTKKGIGIENSILVSFGYGGTRTKYVAMNIEGLTKCKEIKRDCLIKVKNPYNLNLNSLPVAWTKLKPLT